MLYRQQAYMQQINFFYLVPWRVRPGAVIPSTVDRSEFRSIKRGILKDRREAANEPGFGASDLGTSHGRPAVERSRDESRHTSSRAISGRESILLVRKPPISYTVWTGINHYCRSIKSGAPRIRGPVRSSIWNLSIDGPVVNIEIFCVKGT
jgi:hypothetical protein